MESKKVIWHQVVLFSLMLLLTGWRLMSGRWLFGVGVLWWWLGGVLGFVFVFFDWLIQLAVMEPSRVFDVKLKEVLQKKNIKSGLVFVLGERQKKSRLVMKSALFLLVWLVMGFFTLSSIASAFGRGFMLGLGTHLVFDLVWDYFKVPEKLDNWFWMIKRKLDVEEKRWFVVIVVVLYLLIVKGL
ncbi:hypothetical protein KKG65_04310 [Patescibacteria group bacterium]|nr:hypothetical protein [Patescibacteria group bacterium]